MNQELIIVVSMPEVLVSVDESEIEVAAVPDIEVLAVNSGPPGPAGSANDHIHQQVAPATEWIVNHNLGLKPNAAIYDNGGSVVLAEVLHMSDNQLRVYFAAAQSGFARCF